MNFYRDTFVQIDLTQLQNNITFLKSHSKKQLIAVIKANGYGHGAYWIAKKAMEAGAVMLAVSSLDEAITLRFEGIDAPILTLGYTRPRDVALAMHYDITLTATSLAWCEEIARVMPEWKCKAHLKFDSGMNRLGMQNEQELHDAMHLLKEKGVLIEGLYTHYACSDIADNIETAKQYERFHQIIKALDYPFQFIHASNSDATVHFEEEYTNCVRTGIAMLGVTSYPSALQPILSLYSRLTHVKQLHAGDGVSYGLTYHAKQDEYVATIPIGYADGWVRKNQGRNVFIDGQPCELIGRICMDQCMIRLPKHYPVDTVVELIGEHATLSDIAKDLDTIPYEIITLLTDRVPRIYIENQKVVAVDNPRMRYNHSR